MMGEIRVHNYHEISRAEFQTVNVCCAESEFAGACLEQDVWAVGFGQLVCDDLGAIRRTVVDDYEFPVEVSAGEELDLMFLEAR